MSSTENAPPTENSIILSPGAAPNHTGDHGNPSALFLSNGDKKITAAQLLKTIVIANQAANQQQQRTATDIRPQTTENPLPCDLQSFTADPFTLQLISQSQNGQQQLDHQQNAQFVLHGVTEMNNTRSNFNGVNTGMLHGFLNSDQEAKNTVETLHVNVSDQNLLQNSTSFNHKSSMQTFEGLNSKPQHSPEFGAEKTGMLQRLLSCENPVENSLQCVGQQGNYTVSSPQEYSKMSPVSSGNSPYGDSNLSPFAETTQSSTFMDTEPLTVGCRDATKPVTLSDTTTQSTLITNTGNLRLDSLAVEGNLESDVKFEVVCDWNITTDDEDLDRSKNGKVPRLHRDSDASSALSPTVDTVFRADGAQQEVPSDFTFQLFGQGEAEQGALGVFPGIVSENDVTPSQVSPPLPSVVEQPFKTPQTLAHSLASTVYTNVKQQRERLRRAKEPILSQAFPTKLHGYELRILQQPEEQHRARYLTEGSRGSVKNRSGSGYPQVKLFGHTGEATLQVFIGNDCGRVRPHGFYQACKVCGKNSTMCTEKDIDGTTVIEIELQSGSDMTASIDCVGILKLRNADVEQRIGIAKAKKKSTKSRMIFRVTFQKPCGSPQVLQVASSTILCTQPIGQPEICKMSLSECLVTGGVDLYIIGKNFMRGTHVFFQQVTDDETGQPIWEREGDIDKDYFQTTHMIVTVPEFGGPTFSGTNVNCQVVVNSGGKMSDPQPFIYKPVDPTGVIIKQDTMDTVEESRKRNYPFVAPEALELNQQIQQVSSNSDMFQLPPGIIAGMPESSTYTPENRSYTPETSSYMPMEQGTGDMSGNSQSVTEESYTDKLEKEVLRRNSFTLEQKTFGQENLDSTQTWNCKPKPDLFSSSEKSDTKIDLNNLHFPSMNTEEFEDHPMDPNFVHIKSPRLSNEGFPPDHIGITNNARSEDSIVSQFLQNISMALKQSDPMLCGTDAILSKMVATQTNTILTTANSHVLMAADTQHNQPDNAVAEKGQPAEHSFLKEALTCPPVSLDHSNLSVIHNTLTGQGQTTSLFLPKTESGISEMDMQIDSGLLGSNQNIALHQNAMPTKSTESMEFSAPTSVMSNTLDLGSAVLESTFVNSAIPYSLMEHTDQFNGTNTASGYSPGAIGQSQQTEMPFSPSDVLNSFKINQNMSSDMKSTVGLSGTESQSCGQGTADGPVTTRTRESASYQKTIMSSTVQTQEESKHSGSLDNIVGSVEQPMRQGPSNSLAQHLSSQTQADSINAVLQQMLSQAGLAKQQQTPPLAQFGSPQQQPPQTPQPAQFGNPQQQPPQTPPPAQFGNQQQQPPQTPPVQISSAQQRQAQQTQQYHQQQTEPAADHQQRLYHEQQQSRYQQQAQPLVHQQQYQQKEQHPQQLFHQPDHQQSQQQQQQTQSVSGKQQTSLTVTQATTGQTSTTASLSHLSQNPGTPQIIICNNATPAGQLAQTQFGSPSIVIVPGQGGPNNQVENLLRSILGSMMQPQLSQQQPPQ